MRIEGGGFRKGNCRNCGKRCNEYVPRGRQLLCHPCRHPLEKRPLILAGIPCGTIDHIFIILRKCKGKTAREINSILTYVHPIVMENLRANLDGTISVRSSKYVWQRRNGWVAR